MNDKDILHFFGENVKRYRQEESLTQEQLAERVGCHTTYIGMIERAERKISIVAAAKLAKALNVTLNDLINSGYE